MSKKRFVAVLLFALLLSVSSFAAYDDFEDGTINRWTVKATDGGTFSASTSAKKLGSYGGRMLTNGGADDKYVNYVNYEITGESSGNYYTWFRTGDASGYAIFGLQIYGVTDVANIRLLADEFLYINAAEGLTAFTTTPQDNTWYRLRIEYNDNTNVANYYIYDTDNELLESVLGITRSGAPNVITLRARNILAGSYAVDWDNTAYTDTNESEPPPPPPAYSLTLNLTTIGGINYASYPSFYYPVDGNKSIAFDVEDNNNSRLMIDLNYSSTGEVGTGTPIVKDLNMTSDICPDQDWNGETSSCSVPWNYESLPDGNYWVVARVHTFGSDQNTDVSDGNVRFQSYVKLRILTPIDEDSLKLIDLNNRTFSVTYYDGNDVTVYSGLTALLDLNVGIGLSYNVSVEVDENTGDYYKRSRYFNYSTTNNFFDSYQPYLPKNTDSATIYLYTIDSVDQTAVSDVRIDVYRDNGPLSGTLMGAVFTDSSGAAIFSMLLGEKYFLKFYEDSTLLYTASIFPTSTTYSVKLDVSTMTFDVVHPEQEIVRVVFDPVSGSVSLSDANIVHIDINVSTNASNISSISVAIVQNGFVVHSFVQSEGVADGNFISLYLDMITEFNPFRVDVNVTKYFSSIDENLVDEFSHIYLVYTGETGRQPPLQVFKDFAKEYGPFVTSLIALIVTIFVVGFCSFKLTGNHEALFGIAALVMFVFVYIDFVDVILYSLGLLGGVASFVLFRGVG